METTELLVKLRLLSEIPAATTERGFVVVAGEFFHEFLAYELCNLNWILTLMCYFCYEVEVVRKQSRVLGIERARKMEGLVAERG